MKTESTMSRSLDDIYSYYKQSLDLLSEDHPHYHEVRRLLMSQVNDELQDHYQTNDITD